MEFITGWLGEWMKLLCLEMQRKEEEEKKGKIIEMKNLFPYVWHIRDLIWNEGGAICLCVFVPGCVCRVWHNVLALASKGIAAAWLPAIQLNFNFHFTKDSFDEPSKQTEARPGLHPAQCQYNSPPHKIYYYSFVWFCCNPIVYE